MYVKWFHLILTKFTGPSSEQGLVNYTQILK
jgi:hypothetical protein